MLHFFLPAQGLSEGQRGLPRARPPARGFGRGDLWEGEAGQVRSLLGQCMRGPGQQGAGGDGSPGLGSTFARGAQLVGVPGAAAEAGLVWAPWSGSRGSQREVSRAVWPGGSWEGPPRGGRPCQGRSPPGCRPGWTEEPGWGSEQRIRAGQLAPSTRPTPAAPAPCPGSCHLLGRKDH